MSTTLHELTAPSLFNPPIRLRELGVYALPDGRMFVVSYLYAGGCRLYSRHTWRSHATAEFKVGADGRLVSRGLPTAWAAGDLKDTGETASYPKLRIL